jgi:ferredoxin
MSETHKVRFEPVGVDIEADEDETILDAAFRQGVMLMHGCKEGQCSACKSFMLEGDVQMDRYSTFALADYENDEGYVLLCRGHAYSDLEIELVNYDEDMIRSGLPVVTAQTEVESITGLTHDISLVRLRVTDDAGLRFHPGQYVDITIPGTDEHRSFSMANISVAEGILEFVIKRYPGGKFSRLLDGVLAPGDPLTVSGPYGTFTLGSVRTGAWSSLAAAPGCRRFFHCWARWPKAAANGRRSTTMEPGRKRTSSISTKWRNSPSDCPSSGSCRAFRNRGRTTGRRKVRRARPACSPTCSSGAS